MIVTIDGPAASGKSTTAKLVAKKLGISYLDTGGMYRCITFSCMKNNIPYNEISLAKSHLKKLNLSICEKNNTQHFYLNGIDVTNEIRSNEVSKNVSKISSLHFVRKKMVEIQRKYAKEKSIIVEGRDIGTVVFPKADYKFFLIADEKVRAIRRQKDLIRNGENQSLEELIDEIRLRDKLDSERENAPLIKAKDAIVIDTSTITINEQVDFIVNLVRSNMKGKKNE
tara:strand:+ start:187 stop:864 length:678 start_codon:yes stop_codon:yes gene_type:complete